MQRSSEAIGAIAAALAKAQDQLVNPEKSLTGTIRAGGRGRGGKRRAGMLGLLKYIENLMRALDAILEA
jgi:hypothetical protein